MLSSITWISCLLSSITLIQSSSTISFATDLIHRDSPSSPFYDPTDTHFGRVVAATNRSFDRAKFFASMRTSSGVTTFFANPQIADYLMKISIGTPPLEIFGVADTGSDIIWTQCEPCSYCYEQKPPIYNPDNSSSYDSVMCDSTMCMLVPMRSCSSLNNTCLNLVVYGDLSYSSGELATETITLGSSSSSNSFAFTKMVFGCGHRNAGMFTSDQSGIIGLGGGPFSLVSQMVVGGRSFAGEGGGWPEFRRRRWWGVAGVGAGEDGGSPEKSSEWG